MERFHCIRICRIGFLNMHIGEIFNLTKTDKDITYT